MSEEEGEEETATTETTSSTTASGTSVPFDYKEADLKDCFVNCQELYQKYFENDIFRFVKKDYPVSSIRGYKLPKSRYGSQTVRYFSYEFLFDVIDVIKKYIVVTYTKPVSKIPSLYIKGAFDAEDPRNPDAIADVIHVLRKMESYIKLSQKQREILEKRSFKNLTSLILELELQKTYSMSRVAEKILMKDKNAKVVIMLNFIDPLLELSRLMRKYKPLVIYGSTKQQLRDKYVSQLPLQGLFHVYLVLMH